MFVWRYFRVEGEFRREKWRERSFNGCLVGRESGKKCDGAQVFSPWATTKFSLQNREKTGGRSSLTWANQNAPTHSSLLTFFVSSLSLIYAHSCCFGFFVLSHFFSFSFFCFYYYSSIVPFSLCFSFFVTNLYTFMLFWAFFSSYFFFFLSFVFITFFYGSLLLVVVLCCVFFFFFYQFLDLGYAFEIII